MEWPTTRVGRIAVPIVVIAVLGGTFVVGREIALRRAAEVELISASRTGGYVTDDEALVDDLTGQLPVSDELVLAAYCQNGANWLRDFALGLERSSSPPTPARCGRPSCRPRESTTPS